MTPQLGEEIENRSNGGILFFILASNMDVIASRSMASTEMGRIHLLADARPYLLAQHICNGPVNRLLHRALRPYGRP